LVAMPAILPDRPRLLIVSDDPSCLHPLKSMLADMGTVILLKGGNVTPSLITAAMPDLVLLDLQWSSQDAFSLCAAITSVASPALPIVFVIDGINQDAEERALTCGAADCLSRPFRALIVRTRIQTQLTLRQQCADRQDNFHIAMRLVAQFPCILYQYRLYPDGRTCYPFISQSVQSTFGIDPEYLKNDASPWLDLIHPEDRDRVWQSVLDSAQTLSTQEQEYRVVLPEGSVRWIASESRPERLPDQSILWHGYIRDITDYKRMQAALEQKEQLLRHFIEHTPARISMFDKNMRYLAASKRVLDTLGLAEDAILGRSHYDLFPSIPDRWREAHQRGLAGETIRCEEDLIIQRDGIANWMRWEITPWYSGSEIGGILLITEAITERKKAEERERRLTNMFRALCEVNDVIVHLGSEAELYPLVCKAAVECGGMKLAWIGIPDQTGRITPLARCGPAQCYFDEALISSREDVPEGQGPTGIAFRTGRPIVTNEFNDNSLVAVWADIADRHGLRSAVSIPVLRGGRSYAVLAVYSELPAAFGCDMTKLLCRMADNIGFALDNLDREAKRRQAVIAMRESEQRFRDLFEKAPLPYHSLDMEGHILDVNEKWAKSLGYAREEVIGRFFGDFFSETSPGMITTAFARFKARGHIEDISFDVVCKDGRRRRWVVNGLVARDQAGNFIRTHCIYTDITERLLTEKALAVERARLQAILDNAPVFISAKNENGTFVLANQAIRHELAVSPLENFVGKTVFDLFSHDIAQKLWSDDVMALTSGKALHTERLMPHRDNTWHTYLTTKFPVRDLQSGQLYGTGAICHDITERKRIEAEVEASRNRQVELSAKLIEAQEQERKNLARELHDELGQSLTVLNINIHLMRRSLVNERMKTAWQLATDEVASLTEKIQAMSGSLRPVTLDRLGLESSIRQLLKQHFAQTNIVYMFEYAQMPKNLPGAHEITIYRIVQESITNIVRHAFATQAVIEINGGRGDEVELVIRDNGRGFESVDTHSAVSSKRVGLGLIGMQERVSLLRGILNIESGQEGTCIMAKLPVHASSST